ncbi:hypothetical protein NIES25_03990 [Nostoc linckia NIES-25]|nr:hypothetical protein NIES25_03990 [Nostoc linckia NIES-25]
MGHGAWGMGYGEGEREKGKGKRGKIKFIPFPLTFNLFPGPSSQSMYVKNRHSLPIIQNFVFQFVKSILNLIAPRLLVVNF